ncbi:hypothetical protein E2C01_033363 [Portunus trituberculatus]|uniref:Uncharacterized protein n=1 Tax=Portunus trituberculatus TaxID=210409 RepID=A0A5B7F5B8_PORTR|nr:hypothetical protein [Portunus trituberculatus]
MNIRTKMPTRIVVSIIESKELIKNQGQMSQHLSLKKVVGRWKYRSSRQGVPEFTSERYE